ncbi:MAG: hypothetical protein ACKVP3_23080 [Hyphomicrobiaceae bacterium]
MDKPTVTAVELARASGVDPKQFREKLREQGFDWHAPYERWSFVEGSDEHKSMLAVLNAMRKDG